VLLVVEACDDLAAHDVKGGALLAGPVSTRYESGLTVEFAATMIDLLVRLVVARARGCLKQSRCPS
jgi:hypothetical protein